MKHLRVRIALACATVLSTTISTAAPASAAPTPESRPAALDSSLPEFEPLVQAYLRDHPQMSRAHAVRVVTTAPFRFGLVHKLATADPAGFGGAWYDPSTDILHVNAVGGDTADEAAELGRAWGLNVSTKQVFFSHRDLQQVADEINAGMDTIPGSGWGAVDAVNNTLLVGVDEAHMKSATAAIDSIVIGGTRAGAASRPAIQLVPSKASDGSHEQACTDRLHCGNPARSGVGLWHDFEGNYVCSTGFTARTHVGTVSRWVTTAGHCTAGINVEWGHGEQFFGPMRSAHNAPNVDVARIRIDNSYWTTGGHMYSDAGTPHITPLDNVAHARSFILQGEGVCLTAMSGARCGTIVNAADPVSGGLVRVSTNACGGDSGGGWYWPGGSVYGRVAYGLHEGVARDDPPGCNQPGVDSVFTAVPDITAFWNSTDAVGASLRFESRCTDPNGICFW